MVSTLVGAISVPPQNWLPLYSISMAYGRAFVVAGPPPLIAEAGAAVDQSAAAASTAVVTTAAAREPGRADLLEPAVISVSP